MTSFQRFSRLTFRGYFTTFKSLYSTHTTQNISKTSPIVFTTSLLNNSWIYQQNTQIQTPKIYPTTTIELPKSILWIPPKIDPNLSSNLDKIDPLHQENTIEKHAVKLIVIRRHKMRKHKLKKLRKKMKFEWAKRRQRREMRKEKLFQGELLLQIKNAEKFSAKEFVAEKMKKATDVPIPRFWKGRRLPEFIIRDKINKYL